MSVEILDDEKDLLLDHDYDGIKELDNHMPKWWLYLFYFTIAFAGAYLMYYVFTGIGPNQHEEYEMELAEAAEKYGLTPEGENEAGVPAAKEWTFETDAESIENGKAIYMSTNNLCFTCHGNNGEGMVGPNRVGTDISGTTDPFGGLPSSERMQANILD